MYATEERCVELGKYIAETKSTVRACAAKFGVSKSTVHKDVTEKLRECDFVLWEEVCSVLAVNKAQRHLRGGEATRQKYILRGQNERCKEKT